MVIKTIKKMEENFEITEDVFLSEVKHEIEQLKIHATEDEKNNLDFRAFDPYSAFYCIYGQMTGQCTTERAKELMDLSCLRVFKQNILRNKRLNFSNVLEFLNGAYTGQDWINIYYGRKLIYLSALEGFIALPEADNEAIIAYIKGETEILNLLKK